MDCSEGSIKNSSAENLPAAPEAVDEKISSLMTLGALIISPARAFEYLARRPQWLMPALIMLLCWLVTLLRFAVPMFMSFRGMREEMAGEGFPFSMPFMAFVMVVQSVMSLFLLIFVFLMMVGTLYLLIKVFKGKAALLSVASGLACAEFLPRLARVSLQEAIPLFTGGGAFARELPTGIARFLKDVEYPEFLAPLLGRIELFQLWSFVLIVLLVKHAAGISRNRGILVTAAYWAVCVAVVTGWTLAVAAFRNAMTG